MKTIYTTLLLIALALIGKNSVNAQSKPNLAILHIESHGLRMDSLTVAGLVGIEVEKTARYNVADKYDIADALLKGGIDIRNCRSRDCLTAAGRMIKVDNVLTGNVTSYPNKIVVSMRLLNTATDNVDATQVQEFLNLQDNVQDMLSISIAQLLGLPVDAELLKSLTNRDNYENAVNNPNETTVNLSGPRTGVTLFTGQMADAYALPKEFGGYGIQPWLWNFGWQFETQFVNAGYSQALFECLINVAGVEKGIFLPSLTMFIGYRHNKYGLEAGVGPIFSIVNVKSVPELDGEGNPKFDADGTMKTISIPSPKGDPKFSTGLVLAVGKSFKSGRMNFPVTAYVIPRQEGANIGISCGFNVKKKSKHVAVSTL